MLRFQFKRLSPDAKLPTRSGADIGLDIYTIEGVRLKPGMIKKLDTGLCSVMPEGFACLLHDRSSMAAKGIHLLGGVIDAGYRDSWKIMLINLGQEDVEIKQGDKIAQAIIHYVFDIHIEEVEGELPASERKGGFGSTGR